MDDREQKQVSHLIVLFFYTIFMIILTVETFLLGWEKGFLIRLLVGLVIAWGVHIAGKVSDSFEKWLCFIMIMLAFFFYAIHETSFYDLAPLMIVIMLIYFVAGIYSMVNLCMVIYYAVMIYDMVFLFGNSMEYTLLSVSRIFLHFLFVFVTGRIAAMVVEKRGREMVNMKERITALEETNRRTEDFLTNVSHELRTPINVVTGLTMVLLKNEESQHKRENIISVQKAGHRLFRQIEDILDYTEIDTGRLTVVEDSYMLFDMVNDIIGEDQLYDNDKGLEVIFDVDPAIPSILIGDEKKIKKIIKHLLDNAIKFTDQGGVHVKIYALRKPYGINLCIKVTDTGIGMDEESLGRIKEKFYQSSGGRDRKTGGLGLGIPIVYGMAAAMEGFVQVESKQGGGTTVSASIPQRVEDDTPGIAVENSKKLCLACYLEPEKYQVPEVRKFYDEAISHIAYGLDVAVHRVYDMDGLERLISMRRLTHLFIGAEEYTEASSYFEKLAERMQVIVVARSDFALPGDSRVEILSKPFYCLPIANVLNAVSSQDSKEWQGKRMICPGVSVLVVDDEPMNRMVAEGIFKDYQMNVKTAGSGKEAIEICGKEDFDLIFIDHMMPEMDGVETLKQLRRLKAESSHMFTAIAFTANAVSGAREMFFREGFDEFVSKPVEYPELERVLRKVLSKLQIQFVEEQKIRQEAGAATPLHEAADQSGPGQEEETDGQEDEDAMAQLGRAGIHTRSGLIYCRGDREFYIRMLTTFVEETQQKMEEIDGLFEKRDYKNYRIQVHGLKSTSKLLGGGFPV